MRPLTSDIVRRVTDVIAHRGSHLPGAHRENTISAFEHAVALGVAGIELDARLSADGAIVVHHDAHLADGRAIIDTPSAELPGHVPMLAAALDACRGVYVNIEIKNWPGSPEFPGDPDFDPGEGCAHAVIALLAERDEPADNWLISSFHRPTIDRCRQLDPAIPTAWLTVEPVDDAVVASLVDGGHAAVHPWVEQLDAAAIARCHAAGLRVNTWTCNDLAVARALIDAGIDGICTDVPADVLALL